MSANHIPTSIKAQRDILKELVIKVKSQQDHPKDPYENLFFGVFKQAISDLTSLQEQLAVSAKFYLLGDLMELEKIGIDPVWVKELIAREGITIKWTFDDAMKYAHYMDCCSLENKTDRLQSLLTRIYIWMFSLAHLNDEEKILAEGVIRSLKSQLQGQLSEED